MRSSFVLFLIVFVVAGCVTNSPKQAIEEFESSYQVGQHIKDFVVIGEKRIPVPQGKWIVLAKYVRHVDKNQGAIASIIVADLENNAVKGIVYIKARASDQVSAWWMQDNSHYDRKDLHYVEKFSTDKFKRDYIAVHTAKADAASLMKNGIWKDALIRLASQYNIRPPRRALSATFFVTEKYDFIMAQYIWNPNLDSRKPIGVSWKDPNWEYPLYDSDQINYANEIIAWAKDWHVGIKQAIHRVSSSPMVADAKSTRTSSDNNTEAKLRKLKNLFDKGLITKEEYAKQKATILSNDLR